VRGRFIALEGLDGSGKSTQAKLLADALRADGRRVLLTAEPSTGPIGAMLRLYLHKRLSFDPRVLPYLFAADRADHVYAADGILAVLDSGTDVVCDRYVFSSLAYQSTEAPRALVESLNADFPPPDLTLYLEIHAEEALASKLREGQHTEANDTVEKQRAVHREYEAAIAAHGARHRLVRIVRSGRDANAVAKDVLEAVRKLGR
jgi:dTMP kinase